jgi:hypothetical protein
VLIDNIGAFSWQDRASRPPAAQPPPHGQPHNAAGPPPLLDAGPPLTLARAHAAAAALLQLLSVRLRFAVVATKSAAVNWQDTGGGPGGGPGGGLDGAGRLVQREYLPPAWQHAVSHRLFMLPGRPAVVNAPQESLTHVTVQLQVRAVGGSGLPWGPCLAS